MFICFKINEFEVTIPVQVTFDTTNALGAPKTVHCTQGFVTSWFVGTKLTHHARPALDDDYGVS